MESVANLWELSESEWEVSMLLYLMLSSESDKFIANNLKSAIHSYQFKAHNSQQIIFNWYFITNHS